MKPTMRSVIGTAVVRLLRPLVRLMIHHGISFQAFAEAAKWIYVDVAGEQFRIPGRKMSKSRIAVITGLTRREVDRLTQEQPPPMDSSQEFYNRALRVFMGWLEDDDFRAADGSPLPLALVDGDRSFAELVRRYSGNQPVRAVLDELMRVGVVQVENQLATVTLSALDGGERGERRQAREMTSEVAGMLDDYSRELCARGPVAPAVPQLDTDLVSVDKPRDQKAG